MTQVQVKENDLAASCSKPFRSIRLVAVLCIPATPERCHCPPKLHEGATFWWSNSSRPADIRPQCWCERSGCSKQWTGY